MIPLAAPARTGDALAAARELLPPWVVWGRVVAPPVVVFLTQLCTSAWAIALLEHRAGPASGLHWTERARRIAGVAKPLRILSWCILAPALLVPAFLPNPLDPVPGELVALATLIAMYAGYHIGGRWYLERVLGWVFSAAEWRRSQWTRLIVFRSSAIATFACLLFVHRNPSTGQLCLLACATAMILFFETGHGWRLLMALGLAHEFEVPQEVAERAKGVRFLEVQLAMANALALPTTRVVLVTRRARQILEPDELAAGLYHEVGHLLHSVRFERLRLSVLPLLLSLAWMRPLMGWIGPKPTVSLLIGAVILFALTKRKRRAGEVRADAHAHAQLRDPRTFARASERIYAENLVPAVTEEKGTHPNLYDRMLAAGLTPDYPRPLPASSGGGAAIIAGLVLLLELVVLQEWTQPTQRPRDDQGALRGLAIGGFTEVHLRELADIREKRGDGRSAEILRAAAQEIDPQR